MINFRKTIENKLETDEKFRERRGKDKGLVQLLSAKYPMILMFAQQNGVSIESMIAMFQDYSSMDRIWRKVLEERPEIRGKDYGDKSQLEYEVIKQLNG